MDMFRHRKQVKAWRLQSAAVSNFVPSDLGAKLLLWLDAVDLTPGQVSSWLDKSPSAVTFTQGTAANRPIMSATSFGTNPGVTFDGSNDFMDLASAPFPALTAAESNLYAVCQFLDSAQGASTIAPVISYGAAVWRFVGVDFNFNGAGGDSAAWAVGTSISSGRHVLRAKVLGGAKQVYVDTGAGGTSATGAGVTATRSRLGAGSDAAAADFGQFIVRTIIITDGTLTAGQQTSLDAYLMARR